MYTRRNAFLERLNNTLNRVEDIFTPKKVLLFYFSCTLLLYFDRGLVGSTVPYIEESLDLDSVESGSLGTIFMLGYMTLSPFFASMESKYKQNWIMGFGLSLFVISTFGSSICVSYTSMFMSRLLIGISEASYTPIATSVIDTIAPKNSKSTWLGFYFLSMALGAAMGYILPGFLILWLGSWRYGFLLECVLMIPLTVICLIMPESKARERNIVSLPEIDVEGDSASSVMKRNLVRIFSNKTYILIVLGSSCLNFITGALTFWVPTFIYDNIDIEPHFATLMIGITTFICGIFGTFFGGRIVDFFVSRNKVEYIETVEFTGDINDEDVASDTIVGVREDSKHYTVGFIFNMVIIIIIIKFPFFIATTLSTNKIMFFVTFFISEMCLFLILTPVNVSIMKVVDEDIKTLALSVHIFVSHLLGDFLSPSIVGIIRQYFGIRASMVFLATMLGPTLFFFILAKMYHSDNSLKHFKRLYNKLKMFLQKFK